MSGILSPDNKGGGVGGVVVVSIIVLGVVEGQVVSYERLGALDSVDEKCARKRARRFGRVLVGTDEVIFHPVRLAVRLKVFNPFRRGIAIICYKKEYTVRRKAKERIKRTKIKKSRKTTRKKEKRKQKEINEKRKKKTKKKRTRKEKK